MERLDALDRELGRRTRDLAGRLRIAGSAARAAGALGPAYRAVIVLLIARRADRRVGIAAGLAAWVAALVAGRLRGAIGRARPGVGQDGPGLPSRHAAAASAITTAVGRRRPVLGGLLTLGAVVGLAGRVVDGHHDPADIAAGVALGALTGAVVDRSIGGRR